MNSQQLIRATLRFAASCVFLSSAAATASLAQESRSPRASEVRPTLPPSPKPALTGPTKSASGSLGPIFFDPYVWLPVANIGDYYDSNLFPQPVCTKFNSDFKIYLFTNYGFYPGDPQPNNSQNVRVGEFLTGGDTYQRLPHKLPGQRHSFAATSVIVGGPDSTVFLFGGMNGALPTAEVYSYTPSAGFALLGHPIKTDPVNFVWGARTGALAVPAAGKIYLFGGAHGNTVINQVQEFDPASATDPFRILPAGMPVGLVNARGMAKHAPGGKIYIYVVGGSTGTGGGDQRNIYRFEVPTAANPAGKWETVKRADGSSLQLPPNAGAPMATWDLSGRVRIIAASSQTNNLKWDNLQAWILHDDYNLTSGTKAFLVDLPTNDASRARDRASAVKCGSATYLIGGTTWHPAFGVNAGHLVDKLTLP